MARYKYGRVRTPADRRLSAIIFLILGTALLCVGFVSHTKYKKLVNACTESVSGSVVSVDSKRVRSGGRHATYHTEYQATISIDDKSDFSYSTVYSEWTRSSYTTGQQVIVKYDPTNNENYYVEGHSSDKGMGMMFAAGVVEIVGIVYLIMYLKSR